MIRGLARPIKSAPAPASCTAKGRAFFTRAGSAGFLAAALAALPSGCGPPPAACAAGGELPESQPSSIERPISQTSPRDAALAMRYEPTLEMSKLDRFWPVSVGSVLQELSRRGGRVQLVSRGRVVADPPTLADLKSSDAASAYLRYPANLADKDAQMRVFLRGVGVPESTIEAWPTGLSATVGRTAQIYFYDAGSGCSYPGHDTRSYRALQYWFFYPLNYYPMTVDTPAMLSKPLTADTADIDFHEGDWEHVTVLLEQRGSDYLPRYLWTARHEREGKLIPWGEVQRDSSGHPVVYPAFGGHPSYPECGAHPRPLLAAAVYDYAVCRPGLYTLSARTTPLVDLARVSWSCWPGHFGTTEGTSASSNADDPTGAILLAGPRSPLRQAENRHVCSKSKS